MLTVAQTVAQVDACLAPVGLPATGSGHMARPYRGSVAGLPARAELTVFMRGQSASNQMTTDLTRIAASGYRLTIEVDTGLAARFCAGHAIPFLVFRGLPTMPRPWPGVELDLYAHDQAWARRLVEGAPAQSMTTLLHHTEFVEHRPGLLQAQIQGQDPSADGLASTVSALGGLASAVMAPPAPVPAQRRWSDDRTMVVAAAALAFVAMVGLAAGLWWAIVQLL